MNVYTLLKYAGLNSIPAPIKLLGLWSMMVLRRRVIGVFLDPVLACNIRCKMCYFSDPEKRQSMQKGVISSEQIENVAKHLLPHALKLQIGCAAEPTLYSDLTSLIRVGKQAKVPYISITTNGQLIASDKVSFTDLLEAGLNEITVSLHGTTKEIYEELMPGAKFDLFKELIRQMAEAKNSGHKFVIRVNFTVNSLNAPNLMGNQFFQIWDDAGCRPDIVQLRPVQDMGDTEWNDFDLTFIKDNFESTIQNVVNICKSRGIKCIAPSLDALDQVDNVQGGTSALIEDISYCYVSPEMAYKQDFNAATDTFHSYHKRHKTLSRLFKAAFFGADARARNASKKLNYKVN